jgi:hypothetical protein
MASRTRPEIASPTPAHCGGRAASEPPDEQRKNPDPTGRGGLHQRECPERERGDIEHPAADPDRETREPATIREKENQRAKRSPDAERRQLRRQHPVDL